MISFDAQPGRTEGVNYDEGEGVWNAQINGDMLVWYFPYPSKVLQADPPQFAPYIIRFM
jgi:hypothetical protein